MEPIPLKKKFDLGKVTVNPDAVLALAESGQDADFFLMKHVTGDYGGDGVVSGNEERIFWKSGMVFSGYRTLLGKQVFIVTNFDLGTTGISTPQPIPEPEKVPPGGWG